MTSTVVVGGSVAGLATALALSDIGHDVTVLERDQQDAPDSVEAANTGWPRPTVPQTAHSHAFGSLGVNLIRERLPELYASLVEAGALEIDLAARKPPTLPDDSAQPGDEELRMLGLRRPTFDLVLRREVARRSGITVRFGATARGLAFSPGPGSRVTGVLTGSGETIPADVVIDATGRRSPAARWLADAGLPSPAKEIQSCEITYYTRFYRLEVDTPPGPLNRGFGAGGLWDHYTAVLFLGDNRTVSISLGVLPDDAPMKALRTEAAFTAALRATPLLAPWMADGVLTPITGVSAMAGLDNTLTAPPAPDAVAPVGFYPVGDAVCTTNPAYGRGVSLALAHAFRLADTLAAHPEPDRAQADQVGKVTDELMRPWFTDAVANDRGRAMLWRASVDGAAAPAGPPPGVLTFPRVAAASALDATVWRRLVRVMMSLDPPASVYGDPDVARRVDAALSAGPPPAMPPAPTRAELAAVVAAAAA